MVKPHPVGAEAERALQCVGRRRVLLMLSSLTEAYPRQLAKACGIDSQRLLWIMEGHPPQYSELRALLPLGLATILVTSHGRKFIITDKGRRKARMLVARHDRRKPARAAGPAPQVRPHLGAVGAEGVGAPVAPVTPPAPPSPA